MTARHSFGMLQVFATAVVNLDSQFLPFGPNNLRNSGKTLLIAFNTISVFQSVNSYINNGVVISHCPTSFAYDFLASVFFCLFGLLFDVLERTLEISFAMTSFSFLPG